ncbi:MAG TPA: secondary thiamine-phosphate synthase enzyme YjbQ [Candidatus Mediterraneibacter excrementipullorum]|nr:secondary thiamine-phosphate synthase enzyme YjbQ [Candidatus Mediterraneibacter excrementipullorum]
MVRIDHFVLHTVKYQDFINITEQIENIVEGSGVHEGVAFVITEHTTTGITVNEALECLQSDMHEMFSRMLPEDAPYAHGRMLHSYGTTAGNPTGHLRAMLTGNHSVFPVQNGRLVRGGAQEIFFCEYDGAQSRTVYVVTMGEK